jgi:enediyne biosynthesis protein E4
MGVDCADFNNDGLLDLFQTSYAFDFPALFRNTEFGFFDDITRPSGTGSGAFPHVNWGTGFIDFDNDGLRDLFIANGHLQDNVQLYNDATSYKARNVLLRNVGNDLFSDITEQCGDGLLVEESSRGVAFGDLDNDGNIDVVVLNSREISTILRNESEAGHFWIQILLRGTTISRDAVGSRVEVVAGDLKQIAEVHSGRGYQSHFGTRLHFGLGQRDHVDRIAVTWLGGDREVIHNVPVNQCLTIVQHRGSVATPDSSENADHGGPLVPVKKP